MSHVQRAFWLPYWYELDQSIAVGRSDEFHFFAKVPEALQAEGCLIFHHGLWREDDLFVRWGKILSISNVHFGAIRSIDTDGLDYTLTLGDGCEYKIEAEETPGVVYDWSEPITDWRFYVELELTD